MMNLTLLTILSLVQGTSGFGVSFGPTSSRFGGPSKSKSGLADPTAQVNLHLKLVADPSSSSSMEEQATNVMINLAGRYFQMEEMEDSETRTTGMILEPNGTITTLISDIPCLKEAFGTWEQQPQKGAAVAAEEDPGKQQQVQIQMIMTRTFTTGAPKILETDMGEFEFSMERRYTGELCLIGESVGIEGGIHLIHHHENNKWGADETNKVGFFSMIDTETNPDDDQAFDPARGFSLLSTGR